MWRKEWQDSRVQRSAYLPYHPLFVFNQFGDLERCVLRPGNAHSAEGWRSVLEPVIARYRERALDLYFRGDAAFAKPELYELLEAEEIGYAIRLPANAVLQERIGHLLTRPVGRPPRKPQVFFASFSYQAQSWVRPRRVVAKVVRLQLHALAYNLANFLRSLALPHEVEQWSLTTLREKLVKIGARIVRHGRYVVFQLAEVAVPRALFAAILRRIDRLRGPPMVAA